MRMPLDMHDITFIQECPCAYAKELAATFLYTRRKNDHVNHSVC